MPENQFAHAQSTVDEQIARVNSMLQEYRQALAAALDALSRIDVDDVAAPPTINAPTLPDLSFDLAALPEGELELGALTDVPVFDGVDDLLRKIDALNFDMDAIPDAPASPIITIPDAPADETVDMPTRPDVDFSVDLPAPPTTTMPELGDMREIQIPDFVFPDLPTFNGTPPTADFDVPDAIVFDWTEPVYASELMDELTAQVRAMLAGGTGIPPAVEAALFARAHERAARETQRAVSDAFADWAARGFEMPPGMLVKQVNVARELAQAQAAELNRDILIEAAKWEIENLRFAVQQGIALEQLTMNLFENSAKRLFEAAKFHAESRISLLNAQVAVFNARNEGFRLTVEVYKATLDGALAKLQAFKTAVDAQAVIGQINAQTVEVYKARLSAVAQNVEVFKALMEGVKIRVDAERAKLDGYKTDVQAAAEKLNAIKNRFDAYESRMKGEMSKAQVFEAQTRAYAETVRAIAAKTDVQRTVAQVAADAARIKLSAYEAEIHGVNLRNDSVFKKLSAQADVLKTRLAAWEAMARANTTESETKARFIDMGTRTHLAYAETKMKEYEAKLQRAVQEAQIALEAAKAMGQYSTQVVAGAMSAINISAGTSASANSTVNNSTSNTTGTHTNYNYNY